MKVHRKVRLYEKKLILLIFSLFVLLICSESYFYIMSKKYPEIKISQEQFYGKQNENLKDIHFTGELKRYDRIQDFLCKLEILEKVRFTIKGRTVTVSTY